MTDTDREMQESQRRKRPGKQKKKKKSMKGWLVLIVTVGLILAVVFGCRIKTIRITGNERVSDETIQTLIQYDKCQNNSLLLWLLNRKTDISSEPLLNSIHVQLRNPQTIVVQVNEEKLSGYVQSEDEYIYVNDSGKIVLKQTEKLQKTFVILSSTGISMKYLIQQYIKEKMVLLVLISLLDLTALTVVYLTMPHLSVVIPVCIAAGINILQWIALRLSTAKINKTKYADILKEES